MALDTKRVLDGRHVDEILQYRRIRCDADTATDEYRHFVLEPVLLPGAVRTVDVRLDTVIDVTSQQKRTNRSHDLLSVDSASFRF